MRVFKRCRHTPRRSSRRTTAVWTGRAWGSSFLPAVGCTTTTSRRTTIRAHATQERANRGQGSQAPPQSARGRQSACVAAGRGLSPNAGGIAPLVTRAVHSPRRRFFLQFSTGRACRPTHQTLTNTATALAPQISVVACVIGPGNPFLSRVFSWSVVFERK